MSIIILVFAMVHVLLNLRIYRFISFHTISTKISAYLQVPCLLSAEQSGSLTMFERVGTITKRDRIAVALAEKSC